jgi:uroporphyrinogen decarboxylase
MTSRERIIETLNHREPDQLAIDFGAMRSTGIHAIAYHQLVRHLGLNLPPAKLYDVFQQLAEPQTEALERFGGDVVQAHQRCPAFGISIDEGWKRISLLDGTPVLAPNGYNPVIEEDGSAYIYINGVKAAKKPAASLYFDVIVHPYQGCETQDEIDRIPISDMSEEDIDFLEREVKMLYETTDKAILVPFGGNIFEAGQMDFGYEEFYANLLLAPDLMHHYFNRLCENHMRNLEKLLPRIGKYVQVIQFGDDLGTQQAPQISPKTYREMIFPYHARQYQFVQNNHPNAKVFLHCCGSIEPLIPDLIDAGVQVLNPVQLSAKNMDPIHLKREYGKSLSFWGGGANTSETVTHGSVGDVRKETRALIEIFSPGGGYVFTQVHNIQPGVPPENIVAVYDTALAYRREQIGG